MIKHIRIINYLDQTITLYMTKPQINGFIIKNIDGLGPAHGIINISELATGDGGVFNSSKKQTRNIVLTLQFDDDCGDSIETLRQKTYKYFPVGKGLQFQIFTDNRELATYGYVESNEPNIFSDCEGCQISIICPKSYFTDIVPHSVSSTSKNRTKPLFSFPFASHIDGLGQNICFGEIDGLSTIEVYYNGDVLIGFDIDILFKDDIQDDTSDPEHTLFADSLVIVNRTGSLESKLIIDLEKLQQKNKWPVSGDRIHISSVFGRKSVTLNSVSILDCIDRERSVDYWFELYKGINLFDIYIDRLHTEDDLEPYSFDIYKNDRIMDVDISYNNVYEGV